MTDLLRPCPFCGAQGHIMGNPTSRVQCDACCASTDLFHGVMEAIAAWNHRVYQLEPPPAVLPVVDLPIPDSQEIREAVAAAKILLARTPDLLNGEVYRRALDVALVTGGNFSIAVGVCDASDAIAAERERRGGKL